MDYFTFYNMLSKSMQICASQDPLLRKCNKDTEPQAVADSAAASSAAPAPLPETIKTELPGADRLVASGGVAARSQLSQLQQPGCLAAAEQLTRTIKTE